MRIDFGLSLLAEVVHLHLGERTVLDRLLAALLDEGPEHRSLAVLRRQAAELKAVLHVSDQVKLEEEKVAFKDLPNRFPSVLSRDFRKEQGRYEDYDNLFAMYALYNLGRYSVLVNGTTQKLEIEAAKAPMPYADAVKLAQQSAKSDSENFRRRLRFRPRGTPIEGPVDNTHLYEFK